MRICGRIRINWRNAFGIRRRNCRRFGGKSILDREAMLPKGKNWRTTPSKNRISIYMESHMLNKDLLFPSLKECPLDQQIALLPLGLPSSFRRFK